MRISDWSSDVCSSDLAGRRRGPARDPVERRALSLGERLMLSATLRAALDNLLPDAGEDEAYLGTPTLRDAEVLIAFTARPDPGGILTQRPPWHSCHAGQAASPGGKFRLGAPAAIDGEPERQSVVRG